MRKTKYTVKYTTAFKKDYKRAIKRGLKIELLEQVVALLYSLGGGLLSFAGMALLCRILTAKQVWAAGAAGGLLHNLGQMAVALAVTRTPGLLIWLPVLLLCGLVTGLFTGLCAQLLLRRRLISDKGDTRDESQKK